MLIPATMTRSEIPHFEEEGRVNPITVADRMPADTYAVALDYLVFTCVDVVLSCQNQVLLARRNQYPRKSWWILGGRMVAGESPLDTAQRKVLEEAQLGAIAPTRFQYVGAYSTCFTWRNQPPSHHGSHSVNLTYCLELTPAEKGQVNLNQEYQPDWQWISLSAVGQLLDAQSVLDQALVTVIQDVASLNHSR